MRGAVAVVRPAGQVRAFHRLARHAARNRGGVGDPHIVEPGRAARRQDKNRFAQQRMDVLEPPVVAGLLRQVREHDLPLGAGTDMPDPAPLAGVPQQHLSHGQGDQLAVGQQRPTAASGAGWYHVIVDQHVECGQEGVQFFRHTLILNTLLSCPRPGLTSRDLHGISHLVLKYFGETADSIRREAAVAQGVCDDAAELLGEPDVRVFRSVVTN
ncbi:hypothetical protein KIPE111705_30715 [Kibdelosporangium persicum]